MVLRRVGNDQAAEPFADEAMAEYLTRDFIGHRALTAAAGVLDKRSTTTPAACYYETVYVQGELTTWRPIGRQVGNDNFWPGVRQYYNDTSSSSAASGSCSTSSTRPQAAAAAAMQDRFPSS